MQNISLINVNSLGPSDTYICVGRLTITGSDNGLSPGQRQAIIWTNAGILLIGPLGTHFSENSIEILTFSFTKMRLKVSAKLMAAILSRPQCVNSPVAASNGRRTITDNQLNISWTVAPAKARRNSSRSPDWARDTTVLVTDVPMFAPMMIGMAGRTSRTTKMEHKIINIFQSI